MSLGELLVQKVLLVNQSRQQVVVHRFVVRCHRQVKQPKGKRRLVEPVVTRVLLNEPKLTWPAICWKRPSILRVLQRKPRNIRRYVLPIEPQMCVGFVDSRLIEYEDAVRPLALIFVVPHGIAPQVSVPELFLR
jgi:hypothetical protein